LNLLFSERWFKCYADKFKAAVNGKTRVQSILKQEEDE
jgi:hypothetical protein